ncbi:hypothetical protein CIPAW_10G008800 [Carya illinoinensis]|uniref:Uncharacterized protein n=1 Tax=Carya illinoinensis TaxID=32201 RepID=A0A8T1P785_CARIL|nr:hypothetical protein CIPAW_10G008800 [Carya illinoinensis]
MATVSEDPAEHDTRTNATGNELLANCLLPISDVSGAVPIVALSLAGTANFVMITEPMPLGTELLRLPFMGVFGVPRRQMKA